MVNYGDGDATPRARSPARPVAAESDSQLATNGRFRIPAGPSERRDTIADPTNIPRPYRGFPSEAHYLAALKSWAESRSLYVEPLPTSLIGFYGEKTMQEYVKDAGPRQELGLRKKWKARQEKKQEERMARRNTMT